jgi:hypothetical protein
LGWYKFIKKKHIKSYVYPIIFPFIFPSLWPVHRGDRASKDASSSSLRSCSSRWTKSFGQRGTERHSTGCLEVIGPKSWLVVGIPSGKHTKSYWKWPFIVDFPIKNGDVQLLC